MMQLGRDDIMALAVLALFIGTVGGALLGPVDVALGMLVAWVLMLALLAVGMYRIVGPYSAMPLLLSIAVLGLYLLVTASVLTGFLLRDIDDFGVDWPGHIAWFFREVGLPVSLSLFVFLWWRVSKLREVYSELPSERPPSDLPASAVSELVDREEKLRTPLTIVLEMLQRGSLEASLEKAGPTNRPPPHPVTRYLEANRETYRLTAGPGRKYRWEQTVIDALPQEPTTRSALLRQINKPELGIRQQIREYLRHRGLLKQEGSIQSQNTWAAILAILGVVLMVIGLTFWLIRLDEILAVSFAMMGVAYATGMWIFYSQIVMLNEFTAAGRMEVKRWRGFGTHLDSSASEEERETDFDVTDPLLPYSAALGRIRRWTKDPQERPSGIAAVLEEGWRENKVASMTGFVVGFLAGSYIYPGGGTVERVFDLTGTIFDRGGEGFGGGEGVGDGDGGDIDLGF